MPTKRYTLPALRAYLASKPARKWNDHIQHENGTCCVIGHLEDYAGLSDGSLWDHHSPLANRLLKPFARLREHEDSIADRIAQINNGDDPRYQQKTPRARVLKAIDDLIARKVKA